MFIRSAYSRLGQRSLGLARLFSTENLSAPIRPVPKALAEHARPASSILYLYGVPRPRGKNSEFTSSEQVAKSMYDSASTVGTVGQIIFAPQMKNYAWLEFVNTRDATAFKDKYTDSEPFLIGQNAVRIEYGNRRPKLGDANDMNELALRYSLSSISAEDAVKLVQEKYPGTKVTTNVKSTRGFLGTIFVQFESVEAAQDAFGKYWSEPLTFGGVLAECVMPSRPNPELSLYNLKPFAPVEEILEPLKQFGEIVKSRFAFQQYGPNYTGRARIAFNEVSQAEALLKATMNEELVIHDMPVRAEYFIMRYRSTPKPEEPEKASSESA